MHEMSIAQNIIDIVDEYMQKDPAGKLTQVGVEIGELIAVVPGSLSFCYEALVENTAYHGSELKILIRPVTGICEDCGKSLTIKNFAFNCPACQSQKIQVTGGQEFNITHLEVV